MRFAWIVLLALLFVAVGCGEKAEETPAPDPAAPVVEEDKGSKPETPPGQEKQPEDKGKPEDSGKPDTDEP